MMTWTLPMTQPAPIESCWQADEVVLTRGRTVIDRLRADAIERVTLIHAGEGESPGEVRAALFELADRAVLLGAASGIAGRVLFERQAYWARRNCIYWVSERRVAWSSVAADARWPLRRARVLPHRTLTPAAAAALVDRSEVTGPQTWDERKRYRIERRRPFPGRAIGTTPAHSGMLG